MAGPELPKMPTAVLYLRASLEKGPSPGGSDSKAFAYNEGDLGSIPGSGRSPGEGNGNPLQYSCLENPMERGAWWATVRGVTKSWTRLSDFTSLHKRHRETQMKTVGSESMTYFLYW